MRESKFAESQIVTTTYYVWKSKCGGMEASDVQRLRDVEASAQSSNGCTPNLRWRIMR